MMIRKFRLLQQSNGYIFCWLVLFLGLGLSSCQSNTAYLHRQLSREDQKNLSYKGHYKIGKPYTICGKTYAPKKCDNYTQVGMASWYGGKDGCHGKNTANGDKYNQNMLTAAHKTLPLPCLVKVTNQSNNKSLIVMVNDRGPFKPGRIIDVSAKAAAILGFKRQGVAKVEVKHLPHETEKFLQNIALRPKENSLAQKKAKKATTCSVNCHIKLVNLAHKLPIAP